MARLSQDDPLASTDVPSGKALEAHHQARPVPFHHFAAAECGVERVAAASCGQCGTGENTYVLGGSRPLESEILPDGLAPRCSRRQMPGVVLSIYLQRETDLVELRCAFVPPSAVGRVSRIMREDGSHNEKHEKRRSGPTEPFPDIWPIHLTVPTISRTSAMPIFVR